MIVNFGNIICKLIKIYIFMWKNMNIQDLDKLDLFIVGQWMIELC